MPKLGDKISKDSKETEKIAKEFLESIMSKAGFDTACVVGLSGDLGTGKTTFVQFIAKNLGVKTKVNSPTFVIMKRYSLPLIRGSAQRARGFNKFKNLYHLDAYRLKNEKELLHLGWEEIISNPENLVFIEWPELVAKAMPKKHHKISIKHTKEGHRKFKFKML